MPQGMTPAGALALPVARVTRARSVVATTKPVLTLGSQKRGAYAPVGGRNPMARCSGAISPH